MANKNAVPPPPGPGRPKGLPNKSTTKAREAISIFVDGNVERLTTWLDQIAADSPKDAFNCFMSVIEYNIPKLARTEHTGKDGGPQEHRLVNESEKDIIDRYMALAKKDE